MRCDVCKEAEAKVHLTQIINSAMQKIDLCESCAKAKGVSDPTGFSLADLLLGLGQGENVEVPSPLAEPNCPSCGMAQSDFKKSGRLGCAKCYETFTEALSALIKSMHKGNHHVGKRPGRAADRLPSGEQVKWLRHELEEAVKTENFEAAAELRDRLRRLAERIKKSEEKSRDPPKT